MSPQTHSPENSGRDTQLFLRKPIGFSSRTLFIRFFPVYQNSEKTILISRYQYYSAFKNKRCLLIANNIYYNNNEHDNNNKCMKCVKYSQARNLTLSKSYFHMHYNTCTPQRKRGGVDSARATYAPHTPVGAQKLASQMHRCRKST